MEDTLRVHKKMVLTKKVSLNPCFNGRYSQRLDTITLLILILRLNPCFNGRYSQRYGS